MKIYQNFCRKTFQKYLISISFYWHEKSNSIFTSRSTFYYNSVFSILLIKSRVNNVSHYLMIYILISQFIMDISQYVIAFRVFAFFIFALIINKWKINYHLFIALNLIKRTVQAEIAFLNLLKNLKKRRIPKPWLS